MQISKREFFEIPGDPTQKFELPPFFVTTNVKPIDPEEVIEVISGVVEQDDIIPLPYPIDDKLIETVNSAKTDMVIILTNKYLEMIENWYLGEDVLEWIGQCETTIRHSKILNPLIGSYVWPQSCQKNIAKLLADKDVCKNEELKSAIGRRLIFRHLPGAECFSDMSLLYLDHLLIETAYNAWANNSFLPPLPPDRFHFQVIPK